MRGKQLAALALHLMVARDFAWPPEKPTRTFTHADEERIRKAEEKRARKAARRAKKGGR